MVYFTHSCPIASWLCSCSGAGKSVQDLGTVGKSIFVQHYEGCRTVGVFRSVDRAAWFQAQIVQNQNTCLMTILQMHSGTRVIC